MSTSESDPFYTEPENKVMFAGIQIQDMIFIFCGLVLVLFVIYLMWNSQCTASNRSDDEEGKEIIKPSPIFAYELEPGIVVMQSKDGEFFRILHEYDNSPRGARSYGSSGAQFIRGDPSPVHYIPHYTRPVLQTQPSAPQSSDLLDFEMSSVDQPPPYSTNTRK